MTVISLTSILMQCAIVSRWSASSRRFSYAKPASSHRTESGQTRLALSDPTRKDAIDAVLLTLPPPVELRIAKADDIELMLDNSPEDSPASTSAAFSSGTEAVNEDDINSLRDLASGAPVVRFLEELFDRAISLRATDIHIEPLGAEAHVRIRVDGMLRSLPSPGGVVPGASAYFARENSFEP